MSAGPGIYNDIGRRAREVLHQCYPPNPPNSNSSQMFDVTLDSRCQITGILPGLRVFSGLRLPLQGKVEMRYLHEYGGITAGMSLASDQPVINASAVTGTGNFSIGGDLSYDSSTGMFDQYNAALSFSTRTFMASLSLNDKADALRASCYWSGIPKTAVAAEVTHRMFDNDTGFTLGTQHLLFGGTTVKTRASSNGRIAALVEQQLLPWFFLSLTGDANARDVSNSACIGVSALLMSSITSEERQRLSRLRNDPFGADLSFRLSIYHTQPSLRPPPCTNVENCESAKPWQLAFLFSALALLAIGSGGIRPCNISFGADQFDTNTAKGRSQLKSFFNWWYFSFTVALLIALSMVVYIQTNVSWLLGFAIPTGCFLVSIIVFWLGRHVYICRAPQGSVFIDIAKVINAAFRKRKIDLGLLPDLYDKEPRESDRRFSDIPRTARFKFMEKAATIVDRSELDESGISTNSWRLCSIQQVERVKCLVGIIPVWFTGIACFMSMDQMNTLGVLQAMQTNTTIRKFKIPPSWMGLTSMISLALWVFIYECVVVQVLKKTTRKDDVRLTTKTKIQVGIVMSILCMLVAGVVEKKRRQSALDNGTFASPISVAILLPQFIFSGLTEAFAAVAIMEFLNNQFPESMRSVGGSLFFLSLSAASYFNSILVNLVYSLTKKSGNSPWLGGRDLNKDRLENFYFMIAGIGFLNVFYFNFFACHYIFSDFIRTDDSEDSENSE